MSKIQFKRGVSSNLPTLSPGEPALTTDTNKVYVGTGSNNIQLATSDDVANAGLIEVEGGGYAKFQVQNGIVVVVAI